LIDNTAVLCTHGWVRAFQQQPQLVATVLQEGPYGYAGTGRGMQLVHIMVLCGIDCTDMMQ
jgi:hypothetical protein